MCMFTCDYSWLQKPEEGIASPEVGVIVGCKPPYIGARKCILGKKYTFLITEHDTWIIVL